MDELPRAMDAKSNEVNAVFAMVDKSSGCNSAALSMCTLVNECMPLPSYRFCGHFID